MGALFRLDVGMMSVTDTVRRWRFLRSEDVAGHATPSARQRCLTTVRTTSDLPRLLHSELDDGLRLGKMRPHARGRRLGVLLPHGVQDGAVRGRDLFDPC